MKKFCGLGFKSLLQLLFFDPIFYLTRHQDVRESLSGLKLFKSHRHFSTFGREENREHRQMIFGARHLTLLFQFLSPQEDYASGLFIFVRRPIPASKLYFFMVSLDGFRVTVKVKQLIEFNSFYSYKAVQINWMPLVESKRKRYLSFVLRDGLPVVWAIGRSEDAFFYSSPLPNSRLPSALVVSPVTQCNLNCIHCISRSSRSKVEELSDKHWRQIADAIDSGSISEIVSDYSGDLLYTHARGKPWLTRFIESRARLRIDTHANNLTPEAASLLLSANLTSINFSVDTMDEEDYLLIRKGAKSLTSVLDNISGFMRQRDQMGKKVLTILSISLMHRNINTIYKAIAFAKEHNIDAVQGNHLIVFTEDVMHESLLTESPSEKSC